MRQTAAVSALAMGQVVRAGLYPGITPYNHTCALGRLPIELVLSIQDRN